MKKNCFSIFSLWRKYKILLYFNLTVILILSMTFNLTAAGIRDVKSHPKDNPQQVTVKGVVTDASTGQPMPGVNVVVSGTTLGAITDASGQYTLVVPNASVKLQFSFIGYATQEVALAGQTTVNIALTTEASQLSEVVVVGYGTQARKDLTGSISSVNSERLLDKPAFNVAEAISGKVAGVKIVTAGGQPGGGTIFMRIRGTNSISTNNSPLFVVDGIVGVANALTILNPADIKSVDVLKDASATAIYGARGSNGVIMITTKRGVAGKVQVEYNGSYTRGWRQKDFVYNNSEQFLYVLEQAWRNITKYSTSQSWSMCPDASLIPASYGTSTTTYSNFGYLFEKTTAGGYTIPLIGADGNYYKPRFDTNFEDLTFPPSNSTDHNISARGGNENAKFGVFLGYTLDDGLLENSWFKRYSGKVSGDFKVTKWLDVATQIGVTHNNNRTNDVSYFSGGISRAASESYPVIPPQFPNDPSIYGVYAGVYGENVYFPVGEADCQSPYQITKTVETFTKRDQYIGDITLTFHITNNLDLKSNFAVDANDSKYDNYGGIRVSRSNQGNANINTAKSFYWQNENYLTYINNFGDHSVTGMLGLSWSKYTYENLNTYNRLFFDDFYGWHNIGVGTYARPAPSSSDGMNSLNSYFGRFNYSYKGKYLLTVTGRIDGSSKFGANSKYGFFPSGSFAWNMGQEDFIKSSPTISNLKLRLSVGQTGNQEIGSYVTQAFLNSTNVALGESVYTGLYPSSMANPDLRWEKTTQYDAGVDLGLFKDRISLIFDAYYKLTTDMLLSVPLPYSTTVGSVQENYGSVSNKGLEITLNTHNVKSDHFNWYTMIAWSANKNVIEKLGPTGADIRQNSWVGGYNTILREGKSVSEIFGLNRLGTYSTQEVSLAARYGFVPGDVKYEDTNNDGLISFYTDGDILGSTLPKWDMDFTNSMDYRNFDFNIDIRISYGAKKENRTNHSGEDRQVMDNSKNRVLDAWRPDHQNTMIGQLRPGMGGSYYQTYPDTHWVEDASFIRGESATLGYNFEKQFLGINRLRVYANLKNFFVLTKYTGYDPEGSDNDNMGSTIGAVLVPGMDFYMYPRPTELTFGVNIVF